MKLICDVFWQELLENLPEDHKPTKRKRHIVVCGECGERMHLYGRQYVCQCCSSKHGAHPDGKPLGIPADKKTCHARRKAHEVFDVLWKSGRINRSQAYTILRRIMNLTIQEAHIGRFTFAQCNQLIEKLNELGDKVYDINDSTL